MNIAEKKEAKKKKLTHDVVLDYALQLYLDDFQLQEIQTLLKSKLKKDIPLHTLQGWESTYKWKMKKIEKLKSDEVKKKSINLKEMKDKLDDRDYEKITELIEALEEVYFKKPTSGNLIALVQAYKYLRELRTTVTIGENHNDIAVIMANFNQTIINNGVKDGSSGNH